MLILPSASLVQSQQESRERINRITGGGGLPGMQQQSRAGRRGAPAGDALSHAAGRDDRRRVPVHPRQQAARGAHHARHHHRRGRGDHHGGARQRGAEGGRGPDRGARRERLHRASPGRDVRRDPDHRPDDPQHRRLRGPARATRRCSRRSCRRCSSPFQVKYGNQNSNIERGRHHARTTSRCGTTPSRTAGCSPPATTRPGSATRCSARPCPGCSAPTRPAMINQTIQIRGITFEIIGVLSEKGAAGGWGNPDEQILIPLQTAQVPGVRHRPAALDVGAGGGRRADRAGDGGPRAGAAAGAQDPPGAGERLHHPQPAGPPRHPAADHPGVHHAARAASPR